MSLICSHSTMCFIILMSFYPAGLESIEYNLLKIRVSFIIPTAMIVVKFEKLYCFSQLSSLVPFIILSVKWGFWRKFNKMFPVVFSFESKEGGGNFRFSLQFEKLPSRDAGKPTFLGLICGMGRHILKELFSSLSLELL